jgi:hypothetical protein
MRIQITVHKSGFGTDGIIKQVAFATALAMNRTLDEAQALERQGIAERFTLRPRGRAFINRMVKRRLDDFATPKRLTARLRIEGPENDVDRAQILTRHEEGGTRSPTSGGHSIDPTYQTKGLFFLPTPIIRPTFQSEVPRRLYPANLRLTERRDIVGKLNAKVRITRRGSSADAILGRAKLQVQGKERTFILNAPGTDRPLGIFQRHDGKKGKSEREDIVMIWRFKRTVTTHPRLQFFSTVTTAIDRRYDQNFRGFISFASRTAR